MVKCFWLGLPLVQEGTRSIKLETRKATALLAYLSLAPQGSSREFLATMFWPDYDQSRALANLRRALSSLMADLPEGTLEADREIIRWRDSGKRWLDVEEFQQAVKKIHAHCSGELCEDCLKTLEQAVNLYRGEFLESLNLKDSTEFDEWQTSQRQEHQRVLGDIYKLLAENHGRRGRFDLAVGYARCWVGLDKLHEPAQRCLLRLLLETGQKSEARREYEGFCRLLNEQIGQAPDEDTKALYRQIEGQKEGSTQTETVSSFPLLKTKLYIPTPPARRVKRLRLLDLMDRSQEKALTLISAPAGFGKTTLLAGWIAQTDLQVAWLSLDKGDNDPYRFLSYFIAALESIQEGIGNEAHQIMQSLQLAPPHIILASLINNLGKLAEPYVLVMDDYQFITEHDVHEMMTYLLDHTPSNLHLIISTRSDPPLQLGRLRANEQMLELRTQDLRFTPEEAAAFLNGVMRLGLSVEEIDALQEHTEGWVVGLKMAVLSVQGRDDINKFIRAFSGSHRYVLDYLMEEVLKRQPAHVQIFLLETSILEKMNGSLCDALMSDEWRQSVDSAQAVLEHLERNNLFLIPLDDNKQWYRYHHLFADLLKSRLALNNSAKIPILQLQASAWLEQHGFIAEAIHYLFAAHEMNHAADLIERYGPVYLSDGDSSVLRMADRLPWETILSRPKIGLYQAWLLIIQAQIAKALPMLGSIRQQLADADSKSGRRWMHAFIESALAFLSPPLGTPGYVPLPEYKLLDEIPAEELILRNAADLLFGMAVARRGDMNRAVDVSLKCIQREKTFRDILTIPTLASFLSRIYLIQGRLHAAASLCHEYLDSIKERDLRFIYTAGSMKIDLGEVMYEWNCLEEAEQHIQDGLRSNELWRNIMTDGFGLTVLARVLMAKGDYAGAMQVAEKFEMRLMEHAQPREFYEDLRTLGIRVQLANGDLQNPSHWADQILPSEDFALNPEHYRLTLARIRLTQGRYADVEKLLAGMIPVPTSRSIVSRQIESNLLLAVATASQGRFSEALGLIEISLTLAEPDGYMRVFLSEGEPVLNLLRQLEKSELTPRIRNFVNRILEASVPV
jgi:LuxR family maltose regulon positive regulatory protein